MSNAVAQWQIVSKNPKATCEFYEKLFGWTITDANSLGYRQVNTGGGIQGGVWPSPPDGHDIVQLFVQVSDVADSIKRAVECGAQILIPHQKLPDGDEMALLIDVQGLAFGIFKPAD